MRVIAVGDDLTGRTLALRMKAESFEEERILTAIEDGIANRHVFSIMDVATEETFSFMMAAGDEDEEAA